MSEDLDELTPDEAFAAVQSKLVDLETIDTGVNPWTVEGWLHEGTRALLVGSKGEGKSLAALVLGLDVASRGDDFEVYYLDTENGRHRTTARRNAVLADRSPEDAGWARRGFHYSDTFDFRDLDDPALMAEWQRLLENTALVVVDSLPRYLGKLGLNENEAPHISQFVTRYIDPLITNRRTSVLALDNTGHGSSRSRGSTAKEDMFELVYLVTGGQSCSEARHGEVNLRKIRHRDGDEADLLTIGAGGGRYTSLATDTRQAELLREVVKLLTNTSRSKNWVYAQAKENKVRVRKQDLFKLLDDWAQDPYSGIVESLDGGFCLEES
jgi:AAA domain